MEKKPDVLILSGFLGSGKTTVLLRLVEHLHATQGKDYRIAIVENEIGSASIDTGVIAEAGYSVTEMLSGCVCCTLIGQLVPALEKLAEELDPQLVILEATGVAIPSTLHESIERYGGNAVRVCTLVDASRWERIVRTLSILLETVTAAGIEPSLDGDTSMEYGDQADIQLVAIALLVDLNNLVRMCKEELLER